MKHRLNHPLAVVAFFLILTAGLYAAQDPAATAAGRTESVELQKALTGLLQDALNGKGGWITTLLILIGGLAQMYVIIIGGQAYPLAIFPGYEVSSSFFDGAINAYSPSLPEGLLGISGISIAMLIATLAFRLMPFLPEAPPKNGSVAP